MLGGLKLLHTTVHLQAYILYIFWKVLRKNIHETLQSSIFFFLIDSDMLRTLNQCIDIQFL